MLDLLLTSAEEIIKGIKIGGSLGCSALVEFVILRNVDLTKSGIRNLNFGRANFRLFKALLAEISWDSVLRDKDVEESWPLFKGAFLKAQELSMSPCPSIRNQAKEAGNQHDWARIFWSN